MLILDLALILFAAKLFGFLSEKIGQPAVFGKLLVGIVLGPAMLNLIANQDMIHQISEIGVILLMFLAGLETDVQELRRAGKASTFVGLGGIVFPLVGGYVAGQVIGMDQFASIFLGLVLSATSVSISVQTLRELGKLQTKEGVTILGAAVVDDIVVIVLLSFVLGFMEPTGVAALDAAATADPIGIVILKILIFFLVAVLISWKLLPTVLRKVPIKDDGNLIAFALIFTFLLAYFAESTGVAAIIGAYIAGIALGTTKYNQKITEMSETIGYSIFIPVFFANIGLFVQLEGLMENLWIIIGLSILAILTKLVGAGLGAKLSGFDNHGSLAIGTGMISRGEVALILVVLGLNQSLIDSVLFSSLIIVVLVTTLITPPLLKMVYKKG